MDRIRCHRSAPPGAHARDDLGRALTVEVTIGLAVVLAASISAGAIVVTGVAPEFDWQIALRDRHILVIHYGSSPTCASIPNPPQHDCFRPGPERPEFSVDYLTSDGVWSLVWFRLPEP